MGNPLDSGQFVRLLDKRLRLVEEAKYKALPTMIPQIYNVMSSDSAWEEYYAIGAVPDIPEFTGKVPYLSVSPGFHMKIEPKEYSGGLMVERKLIDDKKYAVLDNFAAGLMESAQRTREKIGVRTFAHAFSSAYDFMTSEEGVALCSSSHTTKSAVSTASGFDNAGSSAFSKSAVEATRILMRQFRDDIAERIEIGQNLALIVPDNLADLAMELVGTEKGMDSAEGNINVNYRRYKVIPYLRLDDYDSNNWFMVDLDAMKRDLMWVDRKLPETNHIVDFETYQLKYAAYFRCAYGWKDWRWIYGHLVS